MNRELEEKIGKRLTGIENLPAELVAQFKTQQVSDDEEIIISVINTMYEGAATIDEVLLGIYKSKGIIADRKKVSNKLYRLVKAGLLKTVPKKKGAYAMPHLI